MEKPIETKAIKTDRTLWERRMQGKKPVPIADYPLRADVPHKIVEKGLENAHRRNFLEWICNWLGQ